MRRKCICIIGDNLSLPSANYKRLGIAIIPREKSLAWERMSEKSSEMGKNCNFFLFYCLCTMEFIRNDVGVTVT